MCGAGCHIHQCGFFHALGRQLKRHPGPSSSRYPQQPEFVSRIVILQVILCLSICDTAMRSMIRVEQKYKQTMGEYKRHNVFFTACAAAPR